MAKANVDVYAEVQSPVYEAARQLLLGHVATGGVDKLEELKQRDEAARHNFDLVQDFVHVLPETIASSSLGYSNFMNSVKDITVKDPYEASQVQANIVWLRDGLLYSLARWATPYYVIGQRPDTSGQHSKGSPQTAELLLFPAVRNLTLLEPKVITVWEDEFALMRRVAQAPMSNGYTDSQLTKMFNRHSQKLEIRQEIDGSMYTGRPIQSTNLLPKPPRAKKLLAAVKQQGMSAQERQTLPRGRIFDSTLVDFDVFTHLNRLAAAFDKTEDLKMVFDRYKLRLDHGMPPSSRYL